MLKSYRLLPFHDADEDPERSNITAQLQHGTYNNKNAARVHGAHKCQHPQRVDDAPNRRHDSGQREPKRNLLPGCLFWVAHFVAQVLQSHDDTAKRNLDARGIKILILQFQLGDVSGPGPSEQVVLMVGGCLRLGPGVLHQVLGGFSKFAPPHRRGMETLALHLIEILVHLILVHLILVKRAAASPSEQAVLVVGGCLRLGPGVLHQVLGGLIKGQKTLPARRRQNLSAPAAPTFSLRRTVSEQPVLVLGRGCVPESAAPTFTHLPGARPWLATGSAASSSD